jgi:hypothetical protein
MSVSLERLAWNQVLFREVSERVAEIHESWDGGRPAFLCECGRIDCETTIQLGLSEYEVIRSSPNLFAIAPGHETPAVERIVGENGRFTLVENTNGAQMAVETDPRTRRT